MSTWTTMQIIGACFGAFGIGFVGGSLQRIFRQAVEVLD